MRRMSGLIIISAFVILLGTAIYESFDRNESESEYETKIEALQERNAELTEELKELSSNYDAVRDELWNLNNYLERESVEDGK